MDKEESVEDIAASVRTLMKKSHSMVHPCFIEGKPALVYERALALKDPFSFDVVKRYAELHGYQLKEDQRAEFVAGIQRVKDKKHTNTISILVLAATLCSQAVQADALINQYAENIGFIPDHTESQIIINYDDVDFSSIASLEQLAGKLLGWLNEHTAYEYNVEHIPDIKTVSTRQIAEVAFGGKLPQAVNAENLNIYGLYNFNEHAIYLLDSIDLNTVEGKGILLHELVHYMQYQMGEDKSVDCKNELESLAYVLEAKFLESAGHHHNITGAHINKVSTCT